jgi:hypothetical protein
MRPTIRFPIFLIACGLLYYINSLLLTGFIFGIVWSAVYDYWNDRDGEGGCC